jgi:cell division protein FtsL
MNRRKDQPKTSACAIIAVILTVTIVAAGGVLYVYYKNQQIQVAREIDEVSRHIEHCRLEIRTTDMRTDQLLNRYLIRKRLEEQGSRLRPISVAVVEEIQLKPEPADSVASNSP